MSATTFTRDHALISMTSPLGNDVLVPTALGLEEALDEPFLGVIDMVSARSTIDPTTMLHQPVCLTLRFDYGASRHVHGLVRRFAATGGVGRQIFGYRAEIVPTLWFLSQTQDCRIFENKTTQDILQTIFSEHGLTKVSFQAESQHQRALTVQYNETDLAFVSRLMQEDGWFYWFRHSADGHTLVIADETRPFTAIAGGPFAPQPGEGLFALSAWQPAQKVTHGQIMMDDYDPVHPSFDLKGKTNTRLRVGGGAMRDPFHWPALGSTPDEVGMITRRRMEAAEVESVLSHGSGFDPEFVPGARIMVADRPGDDGKEFLLARVSHHAVDDSWRNSASTPSYSNSFTIFPSDYPWRPAQTVARPRMDGMYSGTVIGPSGEEIHTDKMGRVKIRFRWDRRKDATPEGGVWVRVMQAWAGRNGGWSFIPRVGTEVAVAFMDGDADRPVVVGQLHNGNQLPPWPLPDQNTRSGLRTWSTPNGDASQFSELSFDDKNGSEQVLLHAERDLSVEVEHDATYEIDHDRTSTIKEGNDTLTVQKGNRSSTVSQGNDTLTVTSGNRTVDVTKGNHVIKSSSGDISIKTDGGSVSVEAGQTISLKVGQSSITINQQGVSIKGMNITVEGQLMITVKGPMLELNASAMLKAAGGMIMLN